MSGGGLAEVQSTGSGWLKGSSATRKQVPEGNSEFRQLHRHYALQRRDVVQKTCHGAQSTRLDRAWVDNDYSDASNPSGRGELSDSDDDDLYGDDDDSVLTAKSDASARLLSLINQRPQPPNEALLNAVTALRDDIPAQRRRWRRAAEDAAAHLQRFGFAAFLEDNNKTRTTLAESSQSVGTGLARIMAREVGAQNVEEVHTTVYFELMRLQQELQRGVRIRGILLQTADELEAKISLLDSEWQRLQPALNNDGDRSQASVETMPTSDAPLKSSWSHSLPSPRSGSSASRDYLTRGALPPSAAPATAPASAPDTPTTPETRPRSRLSQLMTATNIRNEAEAQRATNEARAEAQSDEPPADRRSYGNEGAGASNGSTATTKSEESEDSAGKTPFDALREFVNLFDMTCGQGMALVSVNSVIADIAQTVKEKLHKVVVAREAIKPVLYSGEDDRKADDDDDDDEDDATATVLNSRSIMKKGWLVKKGEVRRNWKVRYFVLFEDGRMPYYRGPKKARKDRPQGCIYLTGKVMLVRPATDKAVPNNLWAVEVVTATRTYVLCCRSQSDLDLWCFHLQSFCST